MAKNDYHQAEMQLHVVRNFSTGEIAEEQMLAMKKAEEEKIALAAQAERKAKEEIAQKAAQLAAEKAAVQLQKKKAALEVKYTRIARSGYIYEIEETLSRMKFIQTSSSYETAPDGSTQIATYYL